MSTSEKEHGWSPDFNLCFTRTPTHIYWEDGKVSERTGVPEILREMPINGPNAYDYSLWTDAQREDARAKYDKLRADYKEYETKENVELRAKLVLIKTKLTKDEWYDLASNYANDSEEFSYDEL